jgi:pimeloyl-ACP methyl ester carboxylesterase
MNPERLIFLHGLEGSSQGVKATLLRELFPSILIPDFNGDLNDRMDKLNSILGTQMSWTIIGSSFGGLMAALFACQHPQQVERLILLAPALIWPDFALQPPDPVPTPVLIYHGSHDAVVPLEETRALARLVFTNLTFNVVEDDHGLYQTVHGIDWARLLGV